MTTVTTHILHKGIGKGLKGLWILLFDMDKINPKANNQPPKVQYTSKQIFTRIDKVMPY